MADPKRILIIEDDPTISEMYSRVLVRNGYQVDFALNGQDGINMTGQNHYNLILLDIMMPEMSGIDVLHVLRSPDHQNLGDTKIVILTNLAQSLQAKDALSAQVDGYLIKADVVPSKLLEIVQKMI